MKLSIDAIIEKMESCGWQELPDGRVINQKLDMTFDDWSDAISATIEVGSGE